MKAEVGKKNCKRKATLPSKLERGEEEGYQVRDEGDIYYCILIKHKNGAEKMKRNNSKKTISKEFTLKQTNKKELEKAGEASGWIAILGDINLCEMAKNN